MSVNSVQKAIDLLEKGRAEQAAPLLEDVVSAFPAYAGAFVLLARSYEAGERWTRALEAWRSALLLVPDSPVAAEGIRRSMRQGRRLASLPAGTDDETMSAMAALHHETDSLVETSYRQHDAPDEVADPEDDEPPFAEAEPVETRPVATSSASGLIDESVPDSSSSTGDDHLDRLISELEGARITPRPDLEDIPEPDLEDDIEDMVSETLARIYASQSQFGEAARVYEVLAEQNPDRRTYFNQKAREMRAADDSDE